MGAYSTMWAYLWDLVDEGLSDAVRYCREEIGPDALSVATAYHSYQQMRPHRPGPKLLIEGAAAVYFQPDIQLYSDTIIEPRIAPLVGAGSPLGQLANLCTQSGLDLISWTVCLHNSHLVAKYPDCAQQTAYGDNLGWILVSRRR